MKNRKIKLHDGTQAIIHDAEWRSLANAKVFDAESTEILRVTRNVRTGNVRIYVMRSRGGKTSTEQNQLVVEGADFMRAIQEAANAAELSSEVLGLAVEQLVQ